MGERPSLAEGASFKGSEYREDLAYLKDWTKTSLAEGHDVEEMEQDGAVEKRVGDLLPQGLVGQMGTGIFFIAWGQEQCL